MTWNTLSVDSWREAGAILDHFANPLRSLCIVPHGMLLVVDGDDPLGPGQVLLCRDDELATPCWSGPALRGVAPQPVAHHNMAPTGYADLLRMVGAFAIMAGWEAPRLVMGSRRLLLSYVKDGVAYEEILTPDTVTTYLDAAFWRRAPGGPLGPTDRTHDRAEAGGASNHTPPAPYATWLPALGRYLAQAAGQGAAEPSSLLIEELVGQQVLAVYRASGGTQVAHIVDHETLLGLRIGRPRRRARQGGFTVLSALGAQIDAEHGRALSAHQRSGDSFVLSYTAPSERSTVGGAHLRIRESWALSA